MCAQPTTDVGPAAGHRPDVTRAVDEFRRILRALRLAAQQTQMTSGLSAAQLFVLTALRDRSNASLTELAAATMTDRSSVAAVVERLMAEGLVVRGTTVGDRRRAAISITTRGRGVLRRSPAPPTALLVEGIEKLPPAAQRSLAGSLRRLTKSMGIDDMSAGMLFEDPPAPRRRKP